tara:strand:- start:9901 stop:10146 length:246 start_codon:yes stop_codon:yes gene_type:complete
MKNVKLYFNQKFIGYGRQRYNNALWQALIGSLCNHFKCELTDLNILCISVNGNIYTSERDARFYINQGAKYVFFSNRLFYR